MLKSVIEIREVTKIFGNLVAVDNLSLTIYEGEYVALLGPNGAGKTTLIEMIEGIQHPDSGNISLFHKNWLEHEHDLHRQIGLSLQETRFIDKLKAGETLNLFASFYKLPASRIDEVLNLVKLEEKKHAFVNNLSGGQRQRLALGIALLNNPRIILLDEPTTGLDPTSRREIWNILHELKRKGTTMILTTHYMEEAQVLCDRILIMDKGRFIAEGTLSELITQYGEGDVIEFAVQSKMTEDITRVEGFKKIVWQQEGYKGKIWVTNLAASVPSFLDLVNINGNVLLELECRKMTLDDLFIYLTGRHLYE